MRQVYWQNKVENIVVKPNEELVMVDSGEVSGEATIIVEPCGFLKYFFVPTSVVVPSSASWRIGEGRVGYEYRKDVVELSSNLPPALSFLRRGGTTTRRTLRVELHEDSRAEIYGAVLAEGASEYQFNLTAHHIGARSQSKTLFKGIGKDESKQIFNGMIKIEKPAHQSNAFLENRVLLLSKHATAESKPELEIEANDVKASHAATTGRIDDHQLFYLQSRGIDRGLAQEMITQGFLWEVIKLIP